MRIQEEGLQAKIIHAWVAQIVVAQPCRLRHQGKSVRSPVSATVFRVEDARAEVTPGCDKQRLTTVGTHRHMLQRVAPRRIPGRARCGRVRITPVRLGLPVLTSVMGAVNGRRSAAARVEYAPD